MPFILLIIGAILVIAAIRNTQGDLGNALQHDVPPFMTWALALVAIAALGWAPGLKTPSRWLMALVVVVLVLVNYKALFAGLTGAEASAAGSTEGIPDPAAQIAAKPGGRVTVGAVTGTSGGSGGDGGGFDVAALAGDVLGMVGGSGFGGGGGGGSDYSDYLQYAEIAMMFI